jgi:hypothetical protein
MVAIGIAALLLCGVVMIVGSGNVWVILAALVAVVLLAALLFRLITT